jgi:hypothetical protein
MLMQQVLQVEFDVKQDELKKQYRKVSAHHASMHVLAEELSSV